MADFDDAVDQYSDSEEDHIPGAFEQARDYQHHHPPPTAPLPPPPTQRVEPQPATMAESASPIGIANVRVPVTKLEANMMETDFCASFPTNVTRS